MKIKNFYSATIGALAAIHWAAASAVIARSNGTNINSFSLLKPSPSLQWTPCFDNFTCTILEVPLDYANPSAGTIGIAFIKWTSPNATSAQDLLFNPGGPGNPGVNTVVTRIDELKLLFGTSNNIVSFDPRGVNNSGPDVLCFPGRKDTAKLYNPQWSMPVDSTSKFALLERWAGAGAYGEWCNDVLNATSPAKYVNTVATATDMLHYAEAAAEANGQKREDAKLWYYGFSYGTALGSTFASLFPDRVGRMILDGNLDAEDYFSGKWATNLFDADKALRTFFTYCFSAGHSLCPFWDRDPSAISRRFDAVIADLTTNPIILTNRTAVQTPIVITIQDFKNYLLTVPYDPVNLFPQLAAILLDLEQRNGAIFASVTGAGKSLDQYSTSAPFTMLYEPSIIISCNDAAGRFNLSSVQAWTAYVHFLLNQSPYFGEKWANVALACRQLDISSFVPKSQQFSGLPRANVSTHAPILFISTTVDPVTPLRAARKQHGLFPGSGLLLQNNTGHTSSSAFSACTRDVRENYFRDATLPPEGMVCEVDQVPFGTGKPGNQKRGLQPFGRPHGLW